MDFTSSFKGSLQRGDASQALDVLLQEIAGKIISDRADFIALLNKSGISASDEMNDVELIRAFVDNAPNNKTLLLGASVLVNSYGPSNSFDGDNPLSKDAVISGYVMLHSSFVEEDDQDYSNLIIGQAIKKGLGLLDKIDLKKTSKGAEAAKQKMLEAAKAKREAEKKARTKKNLIIVGSVIGAGLLVVAMVYFIKRKRN